MITVEIGLNAKGKPCRIFIVLNGYDKFSQRALLKGQTDKDSEQSLHLSCRGAMQLVGQLIEAVNKILFHF
jgi:hypothetical protein